MIITELIWEETLMANELRASLRLQASNGNFNFLKNVQSINADQTTEGGGGPGTVSVATSEQTEDMTGYGYCYIRNLDGTNFVRLGFTTGVYNIRLRPAGLPMLIELEAAQTLYLLADTAACNVEIIGLNL